MKREIKRWESWEAIEIAELITQDVPSFRFKDAQELCSDNGRIELIKIINRHQSKES